MIDRSPSQRPRAGAAFAAAMKRDRAAETAWERTQSKLRAVAEFLQSAEVTEADAAYWRAWQELTDAMRDALLASGDELAAQGFVPPESIEEWEHLARIVEMPFEAIRAGTLTGREIHACALAWADRQRMKADLAAGGRIKKATARRLRKPNVRAWTQDDLDKAIAEYKAQRAATYRDLVDGVRRNQRGAKKAARDVYGRNAVARALGVKSPSMVSRSLVWHQLAKELGLELYREKKSKGMRHTKQTGRIGLAIALEQKSVEAAKAAEEAESEDTPADTMEVDAARQETIRQINRLARAGKNPRTRAENEQAAEDLLKKLQRGEITDDEARQVVELTLNPGN
jgi:hypothetical protein